MNYQNKPLDLNNIQLETKMVRGGILRSNFGETSEAIFMNSGFCYNSAEIAESRFDGSDPGFVYSRYVNPTLKMLEDRLALLENGEACCVTSSGMSAVFSSIMCQIKAGDHLIASSVLFGSCNHIITKILPNYGVEISLVDATNHQELQQAFKPNTKIAFIETPANPTTEIIDIEFISSLCKKNNTCLIVDNIFASPYSQSPFKFGADVIVYSTTKHLDGHGRCLGGAVIGSQNFIKEILLPFHRHTGPALSPFNAWIILKSLESFPLRIERHCSNAQKIAEFLEKQTKITKVFYPFLKSHPQYHVAKKQMKNGGALIAFEIKGNKQDCFNFMNKLKLIDISNNLGDSKTLITHPSSTTHSNLNLEDKQIIGISENLCRLSVGIEHVDDLINDLQQALL